MKYIALICARGGSKGLLNKNILTDVEKEKFEFFKKLYKI